MLAIVSSAARPPLGVLTERLTARGWNLVAPDEARPDEVAGVLVLAGEDGLDAGDVAPSGLDFLAKAVAQERPVLAVGPGVEIVAGVLDGEVAARERPEVGFPALHRTVPGRDDPVVAGWPDGSAAAVLQRREVVRLPAQAEQLLIGSDGPSVWRMGSVLAVTPRLDVDPETLAGWFDAEGAGAALAVEAGLDPADVAAEARRRAPFLRAAGVSLLLRWLDALERQASESS